MPFTKVIIKKFEIYTPTTSSSIDRSEEIYPPGLLAEKVQYYAHREVDSDFQDTCYYHFPVLLEPNGEIWKHAYQYLLSKLTFNIRFPPSSTLEKIADNLKHFADFCLQETLDDDENYNCIADFYSVCTRKSNSAIRKYRNNLNDKIAKRELAPSTVKNRLGDVISWLKFLIAEELVHFECSPWEDIESKIRLPSDSGVSYTKEIKSTDLQQSINSRKSGRRKTLDAPFEGKIIDGEELRPLSDEEQRVLLASLRQLNNTEMTLIFLIGLITGARLQTILTLRRESFDYEPSDAETEILIHVGRFNNKGNGLVDSKNDKSLCIYFPIDLYLKIQVYLKSPRCLKRLNKVKDKSIDDKFQYIFISQQGNPLYLSKSDKAPDLYPKRPDGQAVRTFVSTRLKPNMGKLGFNQGFKFHDTRATFGMNMVNTATEAMNLNEHTGNLVEHLLERVKTRMGHSDLTITLQYLKFNENNKLAKSAMIGWEKRLQNMLSLADV